MRDEPADFVRYNFEYTRRIRACFIGAGGHSYRNVYPTFRYAPVDLVAVCDLDGERAKKYAALFGAPKSYSDHRAMLRAERPDAVFIVTSYERDGSVQATRLALDALGEGVHVWMEKPTAASGEEVRALVAASRASNRFVMTGLKKVFFPTIEKIESIISAKAFGGASSIYVRYPQSLPPRAERKDMRKMIAFLDHIYHPVAILHFLMGPCARFCYEWEAKTGASVATLGFASGAIGTLHFAAGSSGSSPLERLEVVGNGENVVLENGVKLIYYRRSQRPAYGRSASFLVDEATAPLIWEPEFSLGQLNNSNLFTLGYAQEVRHFCECVLNNSAPTRGTLEAVTEIMKLYDAYRENDPGVTVSFD